MKIGIDFGTSNSSIAVSRDGRSSELVPIDGRYSVPTALYITKTMEVYIGKAAVIRYIEDNVGRSVELKRKYLGEFKVALTTGTKKMPLYAKVDVNQPGRLFTSLKPALKDEGFVSTNVFGQQISLENLIAKILKGFKLELENFLGSEINSVIFGRPVRYSDELRLDHVAESRMREAIQLAGFDEISFVYEPLGALLAFSSSVEKNTRVLVFDFGGGTLDITIAQVRGAKKLEILATRGVVIGGDDFDRKIIVEDLFPYFGSEATIKTMTGNELRFPRQFLTPLLEWYSLYTLNEPARMGQLKELAWQSNNDNAVQALITLVKKNYGFNLHQEVERVKRNLSKVDKDEVNFRHENIQISQTITRRHFEEIVDSLVKKVGNCLDEVLSNSGLASSDIELVLVTGGASLMPCIKDVLRKRFGEKKIIRQETFTQVARGLALA